MSDLWSGFKLVEVKTATEGYEYELAVPQAEDLEALLGALESEGVEDPEAAIVDVLNGVQETRTKGNGKAAVTEAVKEGDEEKIQKAVKDQQRRALSYLVGTPTRRGRRDPSGLTQAQKKQFGDAVVAEHVATGTFPTQERMEEIADELGLSFSALSG